MRGCDVPASVCSMVRVMSALHAMGLHSSSSTSAHLVAMHDKAPPLDASAPLLAEALALALAAAFLASLAALPPCSGLSLSCPSGGCATRGVAPDSDIAVRDKGKAAQADGPLPHDEGLSWDTTPARLGDLGLALPLPLGSFRLGPTLAVIQEASTDTKRVRSHGTWAAS